MNLKYKISVIVPVYNVENYIMDCIACLQKQTYENFEAILIDDGSKDNSGKLIDAIAKEDLRFISVHEENRGAAAARNKGLEICSGDYVCFVDADDLIADHYLELLLNTILEYRSDVAQCGYKEISSRTDEFIESQEGKTEECKIFSNIEMLNRIYSAANVETIVLWNKIYKKELVDSIRFPEGIMFEDEVFSAEVLFQAKKIALLSIPLYFYYQNDKSVMNRSYTLRKLDILKALKLRMDFFQSHALNDLYEKDSYKYLYKILQNYYYIHNSIEEHRIIEKELMQKYWKKYRETLSFSWTMKRKVAMFFFGIFPLMYSRFRKV